MRSTNNKRTINDVLRYILIKSKNGVLQESMNSIAAHTGYSNATIHRVLVRLRELNKIKIEPASSPNEPQSIVCLVEKEDYQEDIITRMTEAYNELFEATMNVKVVMDEMQTYLVQINKEEDLSML